MKSYKKLLVGGAILGKILLKKRTPLLVSWVITERCNYRCKYCSIWNKKVRDLDYQNVCAVIDKLSKWGTKAIAFIGGEPLLRDDIGKILKYCYQKGIYTKLTTNGSLISKKLDQIKDVGSVKLSFDGPKEVHDSNRQSGSYEHAIGAAELLKKSKIKVIFNCVISKTNVERLDYVLLIAAKLGIRVTFQPLEFRNDQDFIFDNMPSEAKYKKAINRLIYEKKRGNRYIANSLPGLRYLYNWPHGKELKCWAGTLHFRIGPQGSFSACDRIPDGYLPFDILKGDFKSALKGMRPPNCSQGCWRNTTIELNYLLSLHPLAILNAVNVF
ncbi:MAG: radical SAM protein [Candidatus Omnitrophica bacterium]|nr:radical SAM protein [Candidatus Omnitrophota bacterium]